MELESININNIRTEVLCIIFGLSALITTTYMVFIYKNYNVKSLLYIVIVLSVKVIYNNIKNIKNAIRG